MSGNPTALRDMLANMCAWRPDRDAGHAHRGHRHRLDTVIFNMLTIKGIYGREMYETWYKMSVMLQSGLDISPVITHRFGFEDYEEAFACRAQRRRRQDYSATGPKG